MQKLGAKFASQNFVICALELLWHQLVILGSK